MAGAGNIVHEKFTARYAAQFISSFIVVETIRDSIRETIIILDLLFQTRGLSARSLCVSQHFRLTTAPVNFSQRRQLETDSWRMIDENSRLRSKIYERGPALTGLLRASPKQWRTWGMDRTWITALRLRETDCIDWHGHEKSSLR